MIRQHRPITSSPLASSIPSSDQDHEGIPSSPTFNSFYPIASTSTLTPNTTSTRLAKSRSHKSIISTRRSQSPFTHGNLPQHGSPSHLHTLSIHAAYLSKRPCRVPPPLSDSSSLNPFAHDRHGFASGGLVNNEWEEYTDYEEAVLRKRTADLARRWRQEWEDGGDDQAIGLESLAERVESEQEEIPAEFLQDENDVLAEEAEYLLTQLSSSGMGECDRRLIQDRLHQVEKFDPGDDTLFQEEGENSLDQYWNHPTQIMPDLVTGATAEIEEGEGDISYSELMEHERLATEQFMRTANIDTQMKTRDEIDFAFDDDVTMTHL